MSEKNKITELKDEDLKKVAGGNETARPVGTDENTDTAVLENLTDNKGADE